MATRFAPPLLLASLLRAGALSGPDAPCPGLKNKRPTPPCPQGWFASNHGTCVQACPLAAQKRDPRSGRCICGGPSPNISCSLGLKCLDALAPDGPVVKECVLCTPEPDQQEATIGPVSKDYSYASAAAVERWHDMKFGLRIHWGLYAIQGIGEDEALSL